MHVAQHLFMYECPVNYFIFLLIYIIYSVSQGPPRNIDEKSQASSLKEGRGELCLGDRGLVGLSEPMSFPEPALRALQASAQLPA